MKSKTLKSDTIHFLKWNNNSTLSGYHEFALICHQKVSSRRTLSENFFNRVFSVKFLI